MSWKNNDDGTITYTIECEEGSYEELKKVWFDSFASYEVENDCN